ncbi:MAG: glycosyltransferase [Planctomycetota bacterium]
MRVLHVVHGYSPESAGGVETYLADLVRAQRALGLEVHLLAGSMRPWPRCGIEHELVDGVEVTRLHRDDLFFDWHAKAWHPGVEALFLQVLARVRPDVVHVHHWIRLTANLVELAQGAGYPTLVTLHDVYTSCPRAFRVDRAGDPCARALSPANCLDCVPRYGHESAEELLEGIALFAEHTRSEILRAAAVLTPNEAPAGFLAQALGLPVTAFRVLPLPFTPRLPARLPGGRMPRADEPLRLAYFGRLARHKGVGVLVDAFVALSQEGTPRAVELHLFGEPDRDYDKELRVRAGAAPVIFHGAYEPADLASAQLHCAVFPTLAVETHGYVLDEAFELGLPVVVSDLGAVARRAGGAAVRVPPGDVEAWQSALHRLVADPEVLRALAAHIPPPPPTVAAHTESLRAIYEDVRARPGPRDAAGVDPKRRAAFLLMQRESALRQITPPGGPH